MKAADTKIVKGIKEFLSKVLRQGLSSSNGPLKVIPDFIFSTSDILKSKNQEKGSLNLSVDVKNDEFPDIFDKDNYLELIKKMLIEQFKREVRYLRVDWSYFREFCRISFEIKLS